MEIVEINLVTYNKNQIQFLKVFVQFVNYSVRLIGYDFMKLNKIIKCNKNKNIKLILKNEWKDIDSRLNRFDSSITNLFSHINNCYRCGDNIYYNANDRFFKIIDFYSRKGGPHINIPIIYDNLW